MPVKNLYSRNTDTSHSVRCLRLTQAWKKLEDKATTVCCHCHPQGKYKCRHFLSSECELEPAKILWMEILPAYCSTAHVYFWLLSRLSGIKTGTYQKLFRRGMSLFIYNSKVSMGVLLCIKWAWRQTKLFIKQILKQTRASALWQSRAFRRM